MERGRTKKKTEAPAREQTVLQAALWEWEHGSSERLLALLGEPGLLPTFDALLLNLRRLWQDSPPPSPSAAADRLEVAGAPEFSKELREQAHVAHEWDKGAVEAALERLRVERFFRDAAHEKTLPELFERARVATEARLRPAAGVGLRRVWSMSELPEVPPPVYALEGLLLCPAFTIFGGEPGSRKTTLALALALGAIHAAPVLGREMRIEGPALLVENDTPEGVFYGLLRRLERGMGLHEKLPAYPLEYLHGQGLNLAEAEWRKRFLDDVRRLRPAVTILDSFSGAHAADEDKLLELEPVLQCLLEARDITGGLIVAVDHVAKRLGDRRKEARSGRDVRGSGAKVARADAVWLFSEAEGDRSRAECAKQRAGVKPRPFFFAPSDPAEGAPFALEEVSASEAKGGGNLDDKEAREARTIAERILDTLRDRPGLGKDEAWALIRGQRTRFYEAWDLLTALKKVRSEGKRGAIKWFLHEEDGR